MRALKSFLDTISIAALVVDGQGEVVRANAAAGRLLSCPTGELVGKPMATLIATPTSHTALDAALDAAVNETRRERPADHQTDHEEILLRHPTGGMVSTALSCARVESGDGDEADLVVCLLDPVDGRRKRHALIRGERALAFLSGSNRALMQAEDSDTLVQTICQLACTVGGYELAWVGHAEHRPGRPVRMLAAAGPSADLLRTADIRWDDGPQGSGPTGLAIRSGQIQALRFDTAAAELAPWLGCVQAAGLRAGVALPLSVDGEIYGTFSLYSTDPAAFDEEEVLLLRGVADDLAFGIETLRLRQAHSRAEERLRHQAQTDFVTGLANRTRLMERLSDDLRGQATGRLLFLALEHFREINDLHGYLAGDALQRTLARRLRAVLGPMDLLARVGSDEFAVLMPAAGDREAQKAAERLAGALTPAFPVGGVDIAVRARIGASAYPSGEETSEQIYAAAGLASRHALPVPVERPAAQGHIAGMVAFYHPAMATALNERIEITRRLKSAIAHGDLSLHYQPKVDMSSGSLTGAEALARWHDPVLGSIPPTRFIPIAEERGLISDLGRWALEEAGRQVSQWDSAGRRLPGRMAVNVSSSQFNYAGFADRVSGALHDSGCDPARIELEITESVLADDGDEACAIMRGLTDLGLSFTVDDFGTGFSSLSYLTRFPVAALKIDISFIRAMMLSANDHRIVKAVVALARDLGLSVIAEGVETGAQADALLGLDCTQAQGFLYGRAEPADIFAQRWLSPA